MEWMGSSTCRSKLAMQPGMGTPAADMSLNKCFTNERASTREATAAAWRVKAAVRKPRPPSRTPEAARRGEIKGHTGASILPQQGDVMPLEELSKANP